jgi:hypothetical protein
MQSKMQRHIPLGNPNFCKQKQERKNYLYRFLNKHTRLFLQHLPFKIRPAWSPHAYVRVRTYSAAWKMRGVHMRTYVYVRTRPRGVRRHAFVEIRPSPTSRVGSTHCVILILDVRIKLLI